MDWITQVDLSILHMIVQYLHAPWLDLGMAWFTKLGNSGAIWLALGIGLSLTKEYRTVGMAMLLALVMGMVICHFAIKPMVGRLRPFLVDPSFHLVIKPPTGYSFPSGHTWSSFAAVAVAMMHRLKGRYIILLAAVVMAFSRLYLTVHYPTDILGGIIIGLFLGYISVKLVEYYWLNDQDIVSESMS